MIKLIRTSGSRLCLISVCLLILPLTSCRQGNGEQNSENPSQAMSFKSRQIADTVRYLWARCPADLNGDGIMDLAFSENNATGGILGYYEGKKDSGLWKLHVINDEIKDGLLFASGDLECGDMDGDGDADVIAARHPGEWMDAGAPGGIYWYENPEWTEHYIGEVPDAIKDISVADLDNDEKPEVVVITFETSSLSVFSQTENAWQKVLFLQNYKNIHEGMDVGDVDGDGNTDIVADGYIFYNPGDLKSEWESANLDEIWNTQEGDWSRNATKVFMRDIDSDGKDEIFMCHSERDGYPLAYYQKLEDGSWKMNIIADSIAACHTLQVFDFDLDGDFDVLAGMNFGRAVNLGYNEFPVTIFLSGSNYESWEPHLLDKQGIYNGQAADYDGDGDIDIFRYFSHDAKEFYLMENNTLPGE